MPVDAALNAGHPVTVWDGTAERTETPLGTGSLVWRSWGHGRTLLLLHGGAGSWRHWIRNIPHFARNRRVLAVDIPGLGDSALPSPPWSVEGLADLLADGLKHLVRDGEVLDVLGFSFGAQIAGNLAASLGDQVRSLMIVGASGLGVQNPRLPLEKVRGKVGTELLAAHRANLEIIMFADPANIDDQAVAIQAWNSDHARLRLHQSHTTVLLDALRRVKARRFAVWGAEDAVARATLQQRIDLVRDLPGGTTVRCVAAAGHWVAYEQPGNFNQVATDMLGAA